MLPALARFADALRREGLVVSPAETLDAVRAAEAVGVEDRARFRAALRATLVKTRGERERFDRIFDAHFAPPPRAPRDGKRNAGGAAGTGGARKTGLAENARSPRPPARREDARRRPERKGREARTPRERDEAEEPRRARRPCRTILARAESHTPAPVPRGAGDPRRRDLRAPMAEEDERRLASELPKILESLRRAGSRRFRRASGGRLWARRIFRENVSHGGVPFVLPRQRRRPRPTRVELLVDVSWSVARAAGLFLWLAASVLGSSRRVRVVAFVDRPVDATAALRAWMRGRPPEGGPAPGTRGTSARGRRPGSGIVRGGLSFADWLEGLRGLDLTAPSDYGRAFHALLRSHLRPGGRDTVLVVLGDARTNRFEPLPWTLEEIGRRCRAVLWLVPEPRGRWGTGDSALASYLSHVDVVVEAADLAGLARGVAEMVRSV